MVIKLETDSLPLAKLQLHPKNVRAKSPETYGADQIAPLAASIAAVGLLNPLTVQKTEGGQWGVLAGGRRLAALKSLQGVKGTGVPKSAKILCRILPEDCDLATALSFAENDTQVPMKPIDEYEAFAEMHEGQGMSIAAIASALGFTETKVKERLRYGLVAPEIREAARKGEISLEVMKAFATHPDPDVQREVFQGMNAADEHFSPWRIKDSLKDRGVKRGDALGELVQEAYVKRGGEVIADLLPEHSILTDQTLVDEILAETLQDAAEAARAAHGFAWADHLTAYDWDTLNAYDRVYPGPVTPGPKDLARIDEIAPRLAEIEATLENDDLSWEAQDALKEEHEALNDEVIALQEAYDPDDLKRAGVLAIWSHGKIDIRPGLVRPADKIPKAKPEQGGEIDTTPRYDLSQSLKDDLAVERARAVGAALVDDPDLAEDMIRFKLVMDIYGGLPVSHRMGISAAAGSRGHAKAEGADQTALAHLEAARADLDLRFLEEDSRRNRFAAFRALSTSMKSAMMATVLAETIMPGRANSMSTDLLCQIEQEILPDIRTRWRPTGEALFSRLKKAHLLHILGPELGMGEEAANLASATKTEIAAFLDKLFAEPFATLTEDQRAAVAAWAPDGMQVPGVTFTTVDDPGKEVEEAQTDLVAAE